MIRDSASDKYGFFYFPTIAKLNVIMEHKIICLKDGETPKEEIYEPLMGFNDNYQYAGTDYRWYNVDPKHAECNKSIFLQQKIINKCKNIGRAEKDPLKRSKTNQSFYNCFPLVCRTASLNAGGTNLIMGERDEKLKITAIQQDIISTSVRHYYY